MRRLALFLVCLLSAIELRCETPLFTIAELEKDPNSHHQQLVRVKVFWLFDFEGSVISDTSEVEDWKMPLPLILSGEDLTRNSPREFEFLDAIRGFVELCRHRRPAYGENQYVIEVELEGRFQSHELSDLVKNVREEANRTGEPQVIPYPHNYDQFEATKIISITATLKTRPSTQDRHPAP